MQTTTTRRKYHIAQHRFPKERMFYFGMIAVSDKIKGAPQFPISVIQSLLADVDKPRAGRSSAHFGPRPLASFPGKKVAHLSSPASQLVAALLSVIQKIPVPRRLSKFSCCKYNMSRSCKGVKR